MFNPFNRNPAATGLSVRDTLFGDQPIETWPPGPVASEPWASFIAARDALAQGRRDDATAAWLRIADLPNLESRHYAQAWHFLRTYGVPSPPDCAKQLLGVIMEVPMNGGLDLLAAYPEHTARYYNSTGKATIWERPNDSLDGLIDALLREGQKVLNAIGPWNRPRPPAPQGGQWRMNFLSPAGLHFGQAAYETFAKDPMARPVIDTATALMQALVALTVPPGQA
jgi:hypothetical protein